MNTRLVNQAADLICRTMQTHRTPAGIAAALDAAGMLQSPETAAELERLRAAIPAANRAIDRAREGRARWRNLYRAEVERLRAGDHHDEPVCTEDAAHAAGLDVALSPSELDAVATSIVSARGSEPVPEVDLARAVPLVTAEVVRLRARVAELEQQTTAARDLHIEYPDSEHCQHDDEPWPCPTVRAIADEVPSPTVAESAARLRGVLAPTVPPMARPWRGPRGERP
ncbi:hypothetical protein AB0B07_09375 [Streptomyces sioyaensis]|uniref:hypothetical protein n=1 Tax=Streptomyces sioyaensis TaxID=67364 RepID=UPI003405789B